VRVFTRVCRLELLEVLGRDVAGRMPPGVPPVLAAALTSLSALLAAVPELERAHCASALRRAAAQPASTWTLNWSHAENGASLPVASPDGAFTVMLHTPAARVADVLQRLKAELQGACVGAAAAASEEDEDEDEEDEDEDEDDEDGGVYVSDADGAPLVRLRAFPGRRHERSVVIVTVLTSETALTPEAVCAAARRATPPPSGGMFRIADADGGVGWWARNVRCDVIRHAAAPPVTVPPPPGWPRRGGAPRLELHALTGTEGDACNDGTLSTRFDLLAVVDGSGEGAGASGSAPAAVGEKRPREAAREALARALLTYSNGEMDTRGPTLELFEVKERWRRRGVGTALLAAVERFVLATAAPVDARVPVRLALCDAVNERAFWNCRGFTWLDEPLCEEGEKLLTPPAACTCGGCAGGVLSRAFADKLACQADMLRDSLESAISELEHSGAFGSRVALRGKALEEACMDHSTLCFLPQALLDSGIFKSHAVGLCEALAAISNTADAGVLPTPAAVLARWQDGHWSGAARNFFLSRGGDLALAIGGVIDTVKHVDGDGQFDDINPDAPPCANDNNADGVRIAALGAAFPALMPNCADCGTMRF
jgi:GNAT superfamily N-acetyltransferase